MKTIRFLLFIALCGLGFAPAAVSAAPLTSSEQQLVGVWEEYAPSSNVVQFYSDHTMRIYLTEEEGADKNVHFLEGDWSISGKNILTMTFSADGNSVTQTVKLVFEDDEMWLLDEDDGATKHRRLTGGIPAKYRW